MSIQIYIRSITIALAITTFGWFSLLTAQVTPAAHYSFDNCLATDEINAANGFGLSPECACGVNSNGWSFNGTTDFAQFPSSINTLLEQDFTLTFYVQFTPTTSQNPIDIFSLGNTCVLDTFFSVRYFPSINELRVRISDNPGNSVEVTGAIPENGCWHYVNIIKNVNQLSLVINGQVQESLVASLPISLRSNGTFSLANSPCLNTTTDVPFGGQIDEIKIYNRALNLTELLMDDFQPDQITLRDTTIFAGTSVVIGTGGTCSDNFSWSPDETLVNADSPTPIATPTENTTYRWTIVSDNCFVTDEVTISVIDPGAITCEDVKLPTAFTPNRDGLNDQFGISNPFLIESLESFEIFSRWGNRMFYSNDINSPWDGTYRGEVAPPGSYMYKIRYTCANQSFDKFGSFTMIR